jgi:hypothetical protein
MISSHSPSFKSILFIVLLFLCSKFVQAAITGYDVSYNKTIKFTIDRSGKRYSLNSEVLVSEKLLSKTSLHQYSISIAEPYYAPVENIKCKVNKDKIRSENIFAEDVDRKDVFIGNNKINFIKLPDNLKEGDEIKYSYEQEYKDIAYMPLGFIPNISSIDFFQVEIEHPEEISINFEFFFPHKNLKYKVIEESEKTILRFDTLSKFNEIPYGEFKDILCAFIIHVKKDSVEISMNTPASFMKWYSKLKSNDSQKAPGYKNFFSNKIKDNFTPIEKLTVINEYVRENIRYIANEKGISSIVPHPSSEVFEKKYGDCKDKAFLVSAIAKEYGIEVIPALTSTEESLSFSGIHINFFDHVICSYKSENQYLFFDPTEEYMAFATMNGGLAGKPAFILDTINPHYEFISNNNSSSEINIDISGNMDSLGNANAIITFQKDLYSVALDLLNNSKQKDFQDLIPNFAASYLRNISLEIFQIPKKIHHNPDSDKNSITFTARADLSKFIIASNKKSYIPKIPFIFITDRILLREKDSIGLCIKHIPIISMNINLKTEGYSVSPDSLAITLKKSNGYYSFAKSESENKLNLNYVLNTPSNHINSDDKLDFINFCKTYFANKNQMYILTRKTL